jgi:hypothetical protein
MEIVWNLTTPHFGLPDYSNMSGGALNWVKCLLQSGSKKEKRRKMGVMFTVWWMILKERNNKVFEENKMAISRLVGLIKEEIKFQAYVFRSPDQANNDEGGGGGGQQLINLVVLLDSL